MERISTHNDPRISIVPSSSLLSIEENWARILALDLDEYLTILGHDDVLGPDFLSEIVGLIAAEPEASLYHTHFHLIDSDGATIRACKPIPYRKSAEEFLRARHTNRRDCYGTGFVMRSEDYQRVGGLPGFPHLLFSDDAAWFALASLSYKICGPRHLFEYRVHPQSITQMLDLATLYKAASQYHVFLSRHGYFHSEANRKRAMKYLRTSFNRWYHRRLAEVILSENPVASLEDYRQVKARLLAEVGENASFPVQDLWTRFYEAVAFLPGSWLRSTLGWIINCVRIARAHLR